jgi:hypothetical protein
MSSGPPAANAALSATSPLRSPNGHGKRSINKFADLDSIEDRYEGLEGKLRQDQVWADYVIHNCKTLRLFGPKGEQLLSRHEDNNRGDESTIEDLVRSMQHKGNVQGMAGVPIAVPATANQDPDCEYYKLLTYGHRTEAIYRAAARTPNNPQIQATVESGLVNSIVLHPSTPRDVRTWIKRFANSFNMQGVVCTFSEFLDDVDEANAAWLAHTRKENIRASQCGRGQFSWRSLMETFIFQKYPGRFKHMHLFEQGKSVITHLNSSKLMAPFKDMMKAEMRHSDSRLKFETLAQNLNQAAVLCIRYGAPVSICKTFGAAASSSVSNSWPDQPQAM